MTIAFDKSEWYYRITGEDEEASAMKINHKLVDRIAATMFLYCLTALLILVGLCTFRAIFSIPVDDILIVTIAVVGGLPVVSRKRVEALLKLSHRIFKLSY